MFARLFPNYPKEVHRQALQLLDDPSEYPGLPKIDDRASGLLIGAAPSFEPLTSWSIYFHARDRYKIRRVRWDRASDFVTSCHVAEFGWVGEPPKGCEAIADWYHCFVAVLESSLPAHTTFHRDGATHPYAPEVTATSIAGEVHAPGT